eukprot:3196746-Rhodomonas_salina.2
MEGETVGEPGAFADLIESLADGVAHAVTVVVVGPFHEVEVTVVRAQLRGTEEGGVLGNVMSLEQVVVPSYDGSDGDTGAGGPGRLHCVPLGVHVVLLAVDEERDVAAAGDGDVSLAQPHGPVRGQPTPPPPAHEEEADDEDGLGAQHRVGIPPLTVMPVVELGGGEEVQDGTEHVDGDAELAIDPQRDLTFKALEGLAQSWVLGERVREARCLGERLDSRAIVNDSAPGEAELCEMREEVAETFGTRRAGDRDQHQLVLLAEGDDVIHTAMIHWQAPGGRAKSVGPGGDNAIRQVVQSSLPRREQGKRELDERFDGARGTLPAEMPRRILVELQTGVAEGQRAGTTEVVLPARAAATGT